MSDPSGISCSRCRFENPPGMRFCGQCGTPLAAPCPACAFENPHGFAYCGRCGKPLANATTAAGGDSVAYGAPAGQGTAAPPEASTDAERRQLTVLFCDLVGSTALSDRLDPEDLRTVVRSYQAAAAAIVERWSGHIAQYLGDGLLVYFGYPVAAEDDPRRAVRCALEITTAIDTLEAPGADRLQVRLGVHTGPVVAGEIGAGARTDRLALGTTPNLAARLQGLAEPNEVLVSGDTYDLTEGFFRFEPRGEQQLKGFANAIPVYRVLGETGVHDRFELAQERGLTPLIGRAEELALLERRLAKAEREQGQVVLITGEAGVGKSRLVAALRERCESRTDSWLTARCSPEHRATALAPVIGLLRFAFGIDESRSPSAQLAALDASLAERGLDAAQARSLLAPLLSLPLEDDGLLTKMTPQRRRQATLDLLLELLASASQTRPVVLEIDDLHWADPSTLELADRLVAEARRMPLLLLLSFRPEFSVGWTASPNLVAVGLDPLDPAETTELVRSLVPAGLTALVETIVERTDGVPLYVEELTRTVLSHVEGDTVPSPDEIPSTLRDSLTARLDTLGPAKATAQIASVLGRRFPYHHLEAVAGQAAEVLEQHLEALLGAGLLYQRGAGSDALFTFKHALVRDAAYESLLRPQRRELHRRAALALAAQRADLPAEQTEVLARHYEAAELTDEAVEARLRAGREALDRLAFREAALHLERGLELIAALDAGGERDRRELELLLALGSTRIVLDGYASAPVERTYSRARRLCAQHEDPPLELLRGLLSFDIVRGDRNASAAMRDRLLRRAERTDSDLELAVCYGTAGSRAIQAGEFAEAHRCFELSIAHYDPAMHREVMSAFGDDPALVSYAYRPLSLWFLGKLDLVDPATTELQQITEPLGPWAQALALAYSQAMERIRRRVPSTLALAERGMQVCRREGLGYWHSISRFGYGWALAKQGHREGLAEIEEAMAEWESTGARLPRASHLAIWADALTDLGEPEQALDLIDEAIAWADSTLESNTDSGLRAMKARLLQHLGHDAAEVRLWYVQSVEVARRQGSLTLELLSSTALAYFLAQRNETDTSVALLENVCGRFPSDLEEPEVAWGRGLLAKLRAVA